MELSFTKQGNVYVAEATVNSDYALHIERKGRIARFTIEQRHADSGMWAACGIPSSINYTGQVIDWSFGHGVYPCHVRFTSEAEITTAVLTESEGGAE